MQGLGTGAGTGADIALAAIKWTLLVWLNAAVSFYFAVADNTGDGITGIVCGVFTFVLLYAAADLYWLRRNRPELRKALLISVLLKAATQVYPMVEIFTGIVSLTAVEKLTETFRLVLQDFWLSYLATLIDGVLLSLLVLLLMVLVRLIAGFRRRRQVRSI